MYCNLHVLEEIKIIIIIVYLISDIYYSVIALISANIVPSLDIKGGMLASYSYIYILYSYKYFK